MDVTSRALTRGELRRAVHGGGVPWWTVRVGDGLADEPCIVEPGLDRSPLTAKQVAAVTEAVGQGRPVTVCPHWVWGPMSTLLWVLAVVIGPVAAVTAAASITGVLGGRSMLPAGWVLLGLTAVTILALVWARRVPDVDPRAFIVRHVAAGNLPYLMWADARDCCRDLGGRRLSADRRAGVDALARRVAVCVFEANTVEARLDVSRQRALARDAWLAADQLAGLTGRTLRLRWAGDDGAEPSTPPAVLADRRRPAPDGTRIAS